MSLLSVSDKFSNGNNIIYINDNLSNLFFKKSKKKIYADSQRTTLTLSIEDELENVAKEELFDKISDVITVGYKYSFFAERIKLEGMRIDHQQLLLAAIIAADFEDDKRYVKNKLVIMDKSISIDGFFDFRLKDIKAKWLEIANYIPEYFSEHELKSFVVYLIGEKRGKKVLVDGNKVYDRRLNRLRRAQLLPNDGLNIIKEVLISGASEIEIKGELPYEDEFYLKEYFGNKIYFNPC